MEIGTEECCLKIGAKKGLKNSGALATLAFQLDLGLEVATA